MANNLNVFDTIQDYENATIENNSVSYIKEDNSIRYSGGVEHTVQAPITSVKVNGESITTDADGNIDIGNIQEQLVSGTNIKTINGQSLLDSGNIAIDANIQAVDSSESLDDVIANTKEIVEVTSSSLEFNPLLPNKIYVVTTPVTSISISDITPPTGLAGEYLIHFTTKEEAALTPSLLCINTVK